MEFAEFQERDFRSANAFDLVAANLKPGTVIDVGCGGGGLVCHLLDRGIEARGIDIDSEIVSAAKRHLRFRHHDDSRVDHTSIESLLAENQRFDNVVSMDCIEHVADDEQLVRNMTEILKPGGRLVLTVPAHSWLYGPRDEAVGHYRRYDRKQLVALVQRIPLRILELRHWNLLGVAPTFVNHRILRRQLNESFRFSNKARHRVINRGLDVWFKLVERRISAPFGLTLLLVATRS